MVKRPNNQNFAPEKTAGVVFISTPGCCPEQLLLCRVALSVSWLNNWTLPSIELRESVNKMGKLVIKPKPTKNLNFKPNSRKGQKKSNLVIQVVDKWTHVQAW